MSHRRVRIVAVNKLATDRLITRGTHNDNEAGETPQHAHVDDRMVVDLGVIRSDFVILEVGIVRGRRLKQ